MSDLSAQELKSLIDSNNKPYILDVRERLEYFSYNIGGTLIPLGTLQERLEELPEDLEHEIIVVCQKGLRSRTAQKILQQAGYTNVKNLKGGLSAFHRI